LTSIYSCFSCRRHFSCPSTFKFILMIYPVQCRKSLSMELNRRSLRSTNQSLVLTKHAQCIWTQTTFCALRAYQSKHAPLSVPTPEWITTLSHLHLVTGPESYGQEKRSLLFCVAKTTIAPSLISMLFFLGKQKSGVPFFLTIAFRSGYKSQRVGASLLSRTTRAHVKFKNSRKSSTFSDY
jgi:hypothetical protein